MKSVAQAAATTPRLAPLRTIDVVAECRSKTIKMASTPAPAINVMAEQDKCGACATSGVTHVDGAKVFANNAATAKIHGETIANPE